VDENFSGSVCIKTMMFTRASSLLLRHAEKYEFIFFWTIEIERIKIYQTRQREVERLGIDEVESKESQKVYLTQYKN
jgi:hypothetical protein